MLFGNFGDGGLNFSINSVKTCVEELCKKENEVFYIFLPGPNGSSLVDVHSDGTRIHGLERKVVKLENEVTVLETAMAGLANRLLVIEHKSGLNYKSVRK